MPFYVVEVHGRAVQVLSAGDIMDIEESFGTHLGSDMMAYGLWDGEDQDSALHVREAHEEEVVKWEVAFAHARQDGDAAPDDREHWAVWLVPLSEADDDWDANAPRRDP